LLSLYVGGGAAVGSAVVAARSAPGSATAGVSQEFVAGTLGLLGRIGLVGIAAIWLTGLAMVWLEPALASGWAFWVKIVGATVVLLGVLALSRERKAAARRGTPPEPARMERLGQVAMIATIVTVTFAVIAFN
ncbi:MAG: hypothetical protein D6811_00005, partial [Alphaproteobacteria bacterium]